MIGKHTAGPWKVGTGTGYINQVAIEPAIGCAYGAGEDVKANAALIAAAPDMLAALRMLLEYPGGQYSEGGNFDAAWKAAEDAVALALAVGDA